jgi:predicted MFS family arabinose efflux permease
MAGGLLGALTAGPLARLIGEGPVTWVSLAVSSPLAVAQPFLHRDWTLGLFVVAQIGSSAGVVIYNVTQVSFRQRLCPEHLLGRMNASMRFLVWGTMPLGGLLGGALGSAVGVRATLLVAAIGQSLAFLWVFFSPLRSLRKVAASHDHDAAAAAQ